MNFLNVMKQFSQQQDNNPQPLQNLQQTNINTSQQKFDVKTPNVNKVNKFLFNSKVNNQSSPKHQTSANESNHILYSTGLNLEEAPDEQTQVIYKSGIHEDHNFPTSADQQIPLQTVEFNPKIPNYTETAQQTTFQNDLLQDRASISSQTDYLINFPKQKKVNFTQQKPSQQNYLFAQSLQSAANETLNPFQKESPSHESSFSINQSINTTLTPSVTNIFKKPPQKVDETQQQMNSEIKQLNTNQQQIQKKKFNFVKSESPSELALKNQDQFQQQNYLQQQNIQLQQQLLIQQLLLKNFQEGNQLINNNSNNFNQISNNSNQMNNTNQINNNIQTNNTIQKENQQKINVKVEDNPQILKKAKQLMKKVEVVNKRPSCAFEVDVEQLKQPIQANQQKNLKQSNKCKYQTSYKNNQIQQNQENSESFESQPVRKLKSQKMVVTQIQQIIKQFTDSLQRAEFDYFFKKFKVQGVIQQHVKEFLGICGEYKSNLLIKNYLLIRNSDYQPIQFVYFVLMTQVKDDYDFFDIIKTLKGIDALDQQESQIVKVIISKIEVIGKKQQFQGVQNLINDLLINQFDDILTKLNGSEPISNLNEQVHDLLQSQNSNQSLKLTYPKNVQNSVPQKDFNQDIQIKTQNNKSQSQPLQASINLDDLQEAPPTPPIPPKYPKMKHLESNQIQNLLQEPTTCQINTSKGKSSVTQNVDLQSQYKSILLNGANKYVKTIASDQIYFTESQQESRKVRFNEQLAGVSYTFDQEERKFFTDEEIERFARDSENDEDYD